MVSLARGAASSFEMPVLAERRADQLWIARKIFGREAASEAGKLGASSSSEAAASRKRKEKRRPQRRTPFRKL